MSWTSVDLPDPLTPGHARQRAERDADVDRLQVVLARAQHADALAGAPPPLARHRDRQLAAQVPRRQRPRLLQQAVERAREDDAAALLAGAEAQVDDVVGHADHVGVVLDDDDRVALVAQLAEDGDQPLVVARVQADRRLVEHVERADQRRPERRRQVDPLRLAARERRRQPVEREVVEADLAQEPQAPADLGQHLVGDRRLAARRAPGPRRTGGPREPSARTPGRSSGRPRARGAPRGAAGAPPQSGQVW